MVKSDLECRVRKLEGTISTFSAELRLALDYIQQDAGSSLTKSRTVLEKLLIGIYTAEMGHEPRKPMLGEMLADNQFTRKLDRRIVTRMNSIRDMGNLGPHGADVQPSDATRVLDDLCEVLDWYLLRQGAANSGAPANGPALGPATVAPSSGNGLPAAHPGAEKRSAEGGRRNRSWSWLGVGAATLLIILAVVVHGRARSAQELRTTATDVSAEVCASRLSLSRTWPEPIHPAIVAKATVLIQRGTIEQRALGLIALEQHSDADRIIQQIKSKPENSVDESFLLLTLEGDNWYQANDADKALRSYEQAEALKPDDVEARNNLAAALLRSRRGNDANARRAIDIATATLKLAAPGSAEWAKTECFSGLAWSNHFASGDLFANKESAIAAYKSALTVFTKDAYPVEWAIIQDYIGLACRLLPAPPNQPYSAAISAHEAALTVFTKEAFPFEWAETQRALGDALASGYGWGSNRDARDLNRAIAAYDAAVGVFTRQSYPTIWAGLQGDLAAAWLKVPGPNAAENFDKALSHYNSALTVFTKQDYPIPWADAQCVLGAAWLEAPGSDPAEKCHRALSHYDSALTVFTKQEYPVEFALARLKHGEAWVRLAYNEKEEAKRSESFTRAISDFDTALAAISKDSEPWLWSAIEDSRGHAQSALHHEDESFAPAIPAVLPKSIRPAPP